MVFNVTKAKGTGVIDTVSDSISSTLRDYLLYIVFAVIALIVAILLCLFIRRMRSKKSTEENTNGSPFDGDFPSVKSL